MNVASPDISIFDFDVLFDITSANPFVKITNKSVGTNLDGLTYIFDCKSSSKISYHTGKWATPDKTGAWTTWTVPEPILQLLGHVEWSGGEFLVTGWVKDAAGTVLGPLTKKVAICKPAGNTGKDNYGAAKLDIEVKCGEKKLLLTDVTNYSYRGMEGVEISKNVTLIYPPDTTGVQPQAVTYPNYVTSLFNIWYSAPNYQVIIEGIRQYDFGDGVTVKVKYKEKKVFAVMCNVDLCGISCEITKMVRNLSKEGCSGEEREKVVLLNALLNQAIIAKTQPNCGIDITKILSEIQEIGGFSCNCYGDGIAQTGNENDGYTVGDTCSTASIQSINIQ
jgi:hypothetical protein